MHSIRICIKCGVRGNIQLEVEIFEVDCGAVCSKRFQVCGPCRDLVEAGTFTRRCKDCIGRPGRLFEGGEESHGKVQSASG